MLLLLWQTATRLLDKDRARHKSAADLLVAAILAGVHSLLIALISSLPFSRLDVEGLLGELCWPEALRFHKLAGMSALNTATYLPFAARSPKPARSLYLFCHVVYMIPVAPGVLSRASSQPLGLSRLSAS
jgi:hypothetical protein